MPICQKYYTKGLTLDFTTAITIPIGYTLDGVENYHLALTLDKSHLGFNTTEQLRPSLIIIAEEEVELCCQSKLLIHTLQGFLDYNIVVNTFKAVQNFYVDPRTTSFSNADVLSIDAILAYTCPACDTLPIAFNDFEIKILQHEEQITDENGNTFLRGKLTDSTNPFVTTLENFSITRTLEIPFTLTFKPITTQ